MQLWYGRLTYAGPPLTSSRQCLALCRQSSGEHTTKGGAAGAHGGGAACRGKTREEGQVKWGVASACVGCSILILTRSLTDSTQHCV
jgi:hypothetical protein